MNKEEKNRLTRKVTVRFKQSEYKILYDRFKGTTKRKFSDFIRSVLLERKITTNTRNQSLDDYVAELIQLRKELSAIGNNFNQAVKKLHTMDGAPEVKIWAVLNEKSKESFFKKVEEIQEKINQISDKWLRE
jgi:hypothetical protein